MHKVIDSVCKAIVKVWSNCKGIVGLIAGAIIAVTSLCINSPKLAEIRNEYKVARIDAENAQLNRAHAERMAKIEAETVKYQNMDSDTLAELLRNEHEQTIRKMECERDIAVAKANAEAYVDVARFKCEAKKKTAMAVADVASAIVLSKEEDDENE